MTYDQWKTDSGYAERTPEEENEGRDCPICNGDCAGANPPVYNCPYAVEQMNAGERAYLEQFKALPMWARLAIGNLRYELEQARKALEPFEGLADEGNDDQPDDTKVVVQAGRSTDYTLRLSDLRRARDVYRSLSA
jgi:hypothetical protein